MASINRGCNAISDPQTGREMAKVLKSVLADYTALRTQYEALLAKLDADAGVTDTNYAATLTPAAAETTA